MLLYIENLHPKNKFVKFIMTDNHQHLYPKTCGTKGLAFALCCAPFTGFAQVVDISSAKVEHKHT